MTPELLDCYRKWRAEGLPPSRFFARSTAAHEPPYALDFQPTPRGGQRAALKVDGFDVTVEVKGCEESEHNFGQYVSRAEAWCTRYVQVGPWPWDRVTFRSPTTIKRYKNADPGEYQYFRPSCSAAEHAASLFEMGFSKAEAMRLGTEYAYSDYRRAEAFNRDDWGYVDIDVKVRRCGVVLGRAGAVGESDQPDWNRYLACERIDEALDEAKAKLGELVAAAREAVPS